MAVETIAKGLASMMTRCVPITAIPAESRRRCC